MSGTEVKPVETISVQNNVRFHDAMLADLAIGQGPGLAIMAVAAVGFLLSSIGLISGSDTAMLGFGVTALLIGGAYLGIWGQYKVSKNYFQNSTLTLSESGLVVAVNFSNTEARMSWTEVRSIARVGKLVVFNLNTNPPSSIILPLRRFQSQDEASQFLALAHEYWRRGQARLHELGKCAENPKIDFSRVALVTTVCVAFALFVSYIVFKSFVLPVPLVALAMVALVIATLKADKGQHVLIQANSAMAANDHARALRICKEGLKKHPSNALLLVNAAFAAYNIGSWEEGVEYCKAAQKADPALAIGYSALAFGYRELANWSEALSNINMGIELSPNVTWAYIIRASLYVEEKRYEEALKDCDYATSIEPSYYGASLVRALVYVEQGNLDAARTSVEAALRQCEESKRTPKERANVLAVMSIVQSKCGEHEGAWTSIQEAIALDGGRPEHIAIAAANRKREGKTEEASALFKEALEKKPMPRYLPRIHADMESTQ